MAEKGLLVEKVFRGEENPGLEGGTFRRPQSALGLQNKNSFVDRPLALTGREGLETTNLLLTI